MPVRRCVNSIDGIYLPGTRSVVKGVSKFKINLLRLGEGFKMRLSLNGGGYHDEVARIVLVLASDLSSYVYWTVIPVEGGSLSTCSYGGLVEGK